MVYVSHAPQGFFWYNTRMNISELARGMEIFRGLTSDEIDDVIYRLNGVRKSFRKREIVVHAGLEATRLLAVASGRLHVYSGPPGEHSVLMREIGAGEVLGLWILHVPEVERWPGTVVAAESCEVVSFDMACARRLLESGAPAMARLSGNVARILARELFSTWRKLTVMDAPTIETRILVYLSELANESGNPSEIVVPFDRERMAEYLGVTRPALSRSIGKLRDRGLLDWHKNVFRLKSGQR